MSKILEVNNISKSYDSRKILKGVSFSLEKGEVLSIIGSSGGGKTTLLRCLTFLECPDTGSIYVDGECIYDVDKARENKKKIVLSKEQQLKFGLVFQSFNLFPQYNVKKNLTLALDELKKEQYRKDKAKLKAELEANSKKADELLKRVNLYERADRYPSNLSGGQQQRVAIARALMLDPDILCFDEPTSALDPELTGEVLKVIRGLKSSDRTMIIVTHEMEFARQVSDKVMFIADGQIEEMGTPEDIFDNPKSPVLRTFLKKSE